MTLENKSTAEKLWRDVCERAEQTGAISGTIDYYRKIIRDAYRSLGHKNYGFFPAWGACGNAVSFLEKKVALISLNPGGKTGDGWTKPTAAQYLFYDEWKTGEPGKAPLQIQLQRLCVWLRCREEKMPLPQEYPNPDSEDAEGLANWLEDYTVHAPFIPYRSINKNELENRQETYHFCRLLWKNILKKWDNLQKIFIMEKDAFNSLREIFKDELKYKLSSPVNIDTCWQKKNGKPEFCIIFATKGNRTVTLAYLPHLSYYKLFSEKALGRTTENLKCFFDTVYDQNKIAG